MRNEGKINLIFIVSSGFLVNELTSFSGCFKIIVSHNQVTGRFLEGSFHDSWVRNGWSSYIEIFIFEGTEICPFTVTLRNLCSLFEIM